MLMSCSSRLKTFKSNVFIPKLNNVYVLPQFEVLIERANDISVIGNLSRWFGYSAVIRLSPQNLTKSLDVSHAKSPMIGCR